MGTVDMASVMRIGPLGRPPPSHASVFDTKSQVSVLLRQISVSTTAGS
jgi:hypothetical protein